MSNFANGPKKNWNDESEYRGGGPDRGRDRDGPPPARGPPRERDGPPPARGPPRDRDDGLRGFGAGGGPSNRGGYENRDDRGDRGFNNGPPPQNGQFRGRDDGPPPRRAYDDRDRSGHGPPRNNAPPPRDGGGYRDRDDRRDDFGSAPARGGGYSDRGHRDPPPSFRGDSGRSFDDHGPSPSKFGSRGNAPRDYSRPSADLGPTQFNDGRNRDYHNGNEVRPQENSAEANLFLVAPILKGTNILQQQLYDGEREGLTRGHYQPRYDDRNNREHFNGPPRGNGFGFSAGRGGGPDSGFGGRSRNDGGYSDYNRDRDRGDTNGFRGGNRNSDFDDRRGGREDRFAMPNVPSFDSRNDGGFRSSRGGRGRYEDDDRNGRAGFSGGPLFVENSRFANVGEGFEKNRAPRDWVPETEDAENLQKEDEEFLKDLDDALQDTPVEIEGGADLPPFETWEDSNLDPRLIANCRKTGYRKPRPIQAALIPHILNGDNVIGVTETGSGKTASFVLPILNQILAMGKDRIDEERCKLRPFAIIVAPVRELAKQIYHHFTKMAVGTGIAITLSYGEINKGQSIMKMSEGCHVLVGTAGRLMDFVIKATIGLKNLKFFVIDEADRMLQDARGRLDSDHLMAIVQDSNFPRATERQTLLFSATFDKEVEGIATKVMGDPNGRGLLPYVKAKHTVNTRANKRVHQEFIQTDGLHVKNEELLRILREAKENNSGRVPRTLVFVNQKKRSDVLAQTITMDRAGFKAASINGDRPQNEREKALSQFEKGDVDILVGTDVCSRGLDIHKLEHVINYDLPSSGDLDQLRDTYIHRRINFSLFKK
ncbi:hypothetical protein WR25_25223 isoform B [Diploscapter pachys]|uniref:RNA helicase n=1 Tax=Diploscapter pachys TaxID=2018661 RepID=A0A2A2KF82_9BILA|nr:hypothetical protein WR25_25223 isoform B [Diploscapter pachys]